jgi:predicted ester cyclase
MRTHRPALIVLSVLAPLACAGGTQPAPTTPAPVTQTAPPTDAASTETDASAGPPEAETVRIIAQPGTPQWFVEGFAAFRAGALDPIVANFAPDISWEAVGSPLAPPSEGKQAVLERWEDLLTGIPDMKLAAERIFARDDLIVVQVVLTGTHQGDFRGIAPTNKSVGTRVMAWIWHDDKGQAERVRVVYNEAALLAQMGVMKAETVPPVVELPTADPEIIEADADPEAVELAKAWLKSWGPKAWKACKKRFCASSLIAHDAASGTTVEDPAQHEVAAKSFGTAFPNLQAKPVDVISLGDWVLVHATMKGTHKGALGPIEPTKKKIELESSSVLHLEDGKIAESWGYSNHLQLLHQLGLFEAPGST